MIYHVKTSEIVSPPPPCEYQGTPLHHASANGHPEVVARLLAHGADPDALQQDKQSPLHYVCRYRADDDLPGLPWSGESLTYWYSETVYIPVKIK